jgi:hypothetical protein
MDFTFGIITEGNNDEALKEILNSIINQKIDNYEIIIVGKSNIILDKVILIDFDENKKDKWITKKKNLITQMSKYENIVFLHDYIIFEENWYKGFLEYGDNWNICMNVIINKNGNRFRDWCLWYEDAINIEPTIKQTRELLLPYEDLGLSKYMYISGTYWVAKKKVMKEFPLNENLSWGESEDVEWSKRVREKYSFSINQNSSVFLLKTKYMDFNLCKNLTLNKFIENE